MNFQADKKNVRLDIDFFDFKFCSIFNFVDVAIVLGMFVVIYFVAFKMEDDEKLKEARR